MLPNFAIRPERQLQGGEASRGQHPSFSVCDRDPTNRLGHFVSDQTGAAGFLTQGPFSARLKYRPHLNFEDRLDMKNPEMAASTGQ
jgi:hypothetical protein